MFYRPGFVLISLASLSLVGASAQSPNNTPYTLHTGTRIVLTDVTVLDSQGNPVHGLEASDFEISDNGNQQKLKSFEEHSDRSKPILREAALKPRMYSNAALLHVPAVVNVWLLDTTTITLVEQMYLRHQLMEMVANLPADEPVAIYWRAGQIVNLLQNFTSDHERLMAAVNRAIPRMKTQDAQDTTDIDTLVQMIAALSPLPGRKNLLWFSGGSTMMLRRSLGQVPVAPDLQSIFDGIELNRIAVYPIDVRGLTWENGREQSEQHTLMEDTAKTTGGQAFYNNGGLVDAVAHFMAIDGSYYTLTYSPHDPRHRGWWHSVDVKVKGSYRLSYRRGYFDDVNSDHASYIPPAKHPVIVDGKQADAPNVHLEPIVFRARVLAATDLPEEPSAPASLGTQSATPAPPSSRGRKTAYSIRYFLPAADFQQSIEDGKGQVMAGAAILAVSDYGNPVAHAVQVFKLNFDPKQLESSPNGLLSLDQEIDVPKGQNFLYLAVWDTATGRVGTIQLPLDVPKSQQAKR
jgi:VWFA-related protein